MDDADIDPFYWHECVSLPSFNRPTCSNRHTLAAANLAAVRHGATDHGPTLARRARVGTRVAGIEMHGTERKAADACFRQSAMNDIANLVNMSRNGMPGNR